MRSASLHEYSPDPFHSNCPERTADRDEFRAVLLPEFWRTTDNATLFQFHCGNALKFFLTSIDR